MSVCVCLVQLPAARQGTSLTHSIEMSTMLLNGLQLLKQCDHSQCGVSVYISATLALLPRVPAGWTDFDAGIHPWVFRYDYPVFARNGGEPTLYAGQYHTDVVASKARAQIRSAKNAGERHL